MSWKVVKFPECLWWTILRAEDWETGSLTSVLSNSVINCFLNYKLVFVMISSSLGIIWFMLIASVINLLVAGSNTWLFSSSSSLFEWSYAVNFSVVVWSRENYLCLLIFTIPWSYKAMSQLFKIPNFYVSYLLAIFLIDESKGITVVI